MFKFENNKFYKIEQTEINIQEIVDLLNKENLKRNLINFAKKEYTQDYIQIGKYKMCKSNLKSTPNNTDIWEKDWECYFTWEAGMREAKKQWFKIPTKKEWGEIIELDETFVLWFPLSGYHGLSNANYYYQGTDGFYWSSSPYTTYAYGVTISSTQVYPLHYNYRAYGFTVRCIL